MIIILTEVGKDSLRPFNINITSSYMEIKSSPTRQKMNKIMIPINMNVTLWYRRLRLASSASESSPAVKFAVLAISRKIRTAEIDNNIIGNKSVNAFDAMTV